MKRTEEEQRIINEAPDFGEQVQILEEEYQIKLKRRRFRSLILCVFLLLGAVAYVSFSTLYSYQEYKKENDKDKPVEPIIKPDPDDKKPDIKPGPNPKPDPYPSTYPYYDPVINVVVDNPSYNENNNDENDIPNFSNTCSNVNLKIGGSNIPNLNITDGNNCFPKYNVDYYNDRYSRFNIDLKGDRSVIFNPINQLDANGKCLLNCDRNNDGWPDYNIDLNGDKVADINIVKNEGSKCDLNCDVNYDTLPDTNIDKNGDGEPDVNITDGNYKFPKYNVDYRGKNEPVFNIKKEDGSLYNPINDGSLGKSCDSNCDIDGDGRPDYNIKLKEDSDIILNEVISQNNNNIFVNHLHQTDWKCNIPNELSYCDKNVEVPSFKYINIDFDGDDIPDINVSNDQGNTIVNEVNKTGRYNGRDIILNEDTDNDGWPDVNIDVDNDGIPDVNITNGQNNICTKNCDTNNDGIADYLIEIGNKIYARDRLNIDINADGKCDTNCDVTNDIYPDINIDINGDTIPDINIDFDGNGTPDFNIDVNGDKIPDKNLDAYGIGICTFNCGEQANENKVDNSSSCIKNCDTDGNGWPDKNVDINNDGICDFNCDGLVNDSNNNYYEDSKENSAAFEAIQSSQDNITIASPLEIKDNDIAPGDENKYVLYVVNTTDGNMYYNLRWKDVTNTFTTYNLDYMITRNNILYRNDLKAPYSDEVVEENVFVRSKCIYKYTIDISWKETGENQNVDSGKVFSGKFIVDINN